MTETQVLPNPQARLHVLQHAGLLTSFLAALWSTAAHPLLQKWN